MIQLARVVFRQGVDAPGRNPVTETRFHAEGRLGKKGWNLRFDAGLVTIEDHETRERRLVPLNNVIEMTPATPEAKR